MKPIRLFLRLAVSAVLLGILFLGIDWGEALPLIARCHLGPVAAAWLVFFFLVGISVVKWDILLQGQKIRVAKFRLLRNYWIGFFSSNFLPSNVGGDVVRLALMRREGNLAGVASSIFMERLTGFWVLLLLSCGALALRPRLFQVPDSLGLVVLFLLAAATLGIVLSGEKIYAAIGRTAQTFPPLAGRINPSAVLGHPHRKGAIVRCVLLSFLFYALRAGQHGLVIHALDLDLHWLDILCIAPLIDLAWALPVSVSGLGVVEGAFVLLYSSAGLSPAQGLAIALLMRLTHVTASALGGIFMLEGRSNAH